MRILVTGGAGFIGSHLVDRLIKEGHRVIIIDNLSTGKKENINPAFFKKNGADFGAKFYQMDICSFKISDVFKKEKPQVVFHCAAQINVRKSVENPIEDAKINILGSLNIIQSFVRTNLRSNRQKFAKIIFTSTGGAIYGDTNVIPTPESFPELPISPYGVAKLSVEKYLNYYFKVFGLPYISLRLANVYGPRQDSEGEAGVVAIFCEKMIKGKQPVIFGSGRQTRDFVYVKDVVEAHILALKKKRVGIYNIGTGKETNINKIFDLIKKYTAAQYKKEYHSPRKGEQKRSCLDYSKAKKELDWEPKYDLDGGIRETVEWFKK